MRHNIHALLTGARPNKPKWQNSNSYETGCPFIDGTVNHVNPWIQRNVAQRTTAPRAADLLVGAHYVTRTGTPFGMLKTDVTKAHRRIKLLKKDWG